jgi:hypothetical protein
MQFDVVVDEIEKQWCELQTTIYPVYNGTPGELIGYGCLPNAGFGSGRGCPGSDVGSDAAPSCFWGSDVDAAACHPVDCGKLALCTFGRPNPCRCTQTHCTVDLTQPSLGTLHADLQVSGAKADGSIAGLADSLGPVNVHLERH